MTPSFGQWMASPACLCPLKGLCWSKDPENPALGLLGASSPVLVMDEEIQPLQAADPSLKEFRRLAGRIGPTLAMCEMVYYIEWMLM